MDYTRLQKVCFEAGCLFNKKGYSSTKMIEIAKASDIAVGTMYSMFTGKEAILTFIIESSFDKDYFSKEILFPIKPTDPAILYIKLKEKSDFLFQSILNIQSSNGMIKKDFCTLIEELFDFFATHLIAIDNIKHNAEQLGELKKLYLPEEKKFFEKFETCLNLYIETGQIRPIDYLPLYIPFLVNTLTWWAMNSLLSVESVTIPREIAKKICLEIIQRTYLP